MDDLEQLRKAILNKYSNLNATELPTSMAVPIGSDGFQRGIDVLGPDNDACYLWASNLTPNTTTPPFPNLSLYYDFTPHPAITLGNGTNEFIIVYGVNHVATGKATYSNIVPYGAKGWNGVVAIYDTEFNGTAKEYLLIVPTRSISMSTRLPGIVMAICTASRCPLVREPTA